MLFLLKITLYSENKNIFSAIHINIWKHVDIYLVGQVLLVKSSWEYMKELVRGKGHTEQENTLVPCTYRNVKVLVGQSSDCVTRWTVAYQASIQCKYTQSYKTKPLSSRNGALQSSWGGDGSSHLLQKLWINQIKFPYSKSTREALPWDGSVCSNIWSLSSPRLNVLLTTLVKTSEISYYLSN